MADNTKKYLEEFDKQNKSVLNNQIATVQSTAEKNKNTVNENYGAKIGETETAYDDQYRINAVQKLINEREVAESMANSGLTDSGLNRTQQTAVQLSYANNKASLDRQKQSAVDALTREMNAYLTEIETGAASQIAALNDTYNQNRNSYAVNKYQADLEAETQRLKNQQDYNLSLIKLQQEAAKNPTNIISANDAPLSRDFGGTLKENGVTVTYNTNEYGDRSTTTYYDTVTGKKTTVAFSVNPYTKSNNAVGSSDTSKAWNKYGYYDNGYQPKGVVYNGKYYGYVKSSGMTDIINGNRQNVHKTDDGSLWIWDGKQNKYRPYKSE